MRMYVFWPRRRWVLTMTTILITVQSSSGISRAPDLMGQYCAARSAPYQCCQGRSDSCAAPILDTLCYCDTFCKNTTNDDCCPDYDEICGQIRPPISQEKGCSLDGQTYRPGRSFKRNCNDCSCKEDGKICCDLTVCVTDTYLLQRIESMDLGWEPANYTKFWGREYAKTLNELARARHSNETILRRYQQHARHLARLKSKPQVPAEFDSRLEWPGMISRIADQGWCNTAWAHSTVSTMNDRLRIHSMDEKIKLSVEEMIDCSHSKQKGCLGSGELDRARYYLQKRGLRSANLYRRDVPFQCSSSTKKSKSRYRSGPWYMISGEANIQKEILDSGPVLATMRIYRDFFSYGSGIYRRSGQDPDEGNRSGFLPVKIIGWGEKKRNKYWVVANSWGREWGEDGYFRIRRGTNECGIEDFVFAAWGPPLRWPGTSTNHKHSMDSSNTTQILKIIAGPSGRRKID